MRIYTVPGVGTYPCLHIKNCVYPTSIRGSPKAVLNRYQYRYRYRTWYVVVPRTRRWPCSLFYWFPISSPVSYVHSTHRYIKYGTSFSQRTRILHDTDNGHPGFKAGFFATRVRVVVRSLPTLTVIVIQKCSYQKTILSYDWPNYVAFDHAGARK
jgi:hypothetical protein